MTLLTGAADVWIIGIGWSGFQPTVPHLSFRELMFLSVQRAFQDAGVEEPRKVVDAVIVCQEDYWEGVSISDEFAPDPTGGVMKPVFTVAGEGLQCLAQAYLILRTGVFKTILVESHGKPSDVVDMRIVEKYLMDPHLHRPVGLSPIAVAGLDAESFLRRWGLQAEAIAEGVESLLRKGRNNPINCRGAYLTCREIMETPQVAGPLREGMLAPACDGSVSLLLTSDSSLARDSEGGPVKVLSVGWESEASVTLLDLHDWGRARHARGAWARALASLKNQGHFNWGDSALSIDDRYGYNLLLNMLELGVSDTRDLLKTVEGGTPLVNPLGGLQTGGVPLEAGGLVLALEAVEALRQGYARRSGVLAWRSFPSLSSTAVLLEAS